MGSVKRCLKKPVGRSTLKIEEMQTLLVEIKCTLNTVGRINFEDKKFQGFRGYVVNLENKYPCNFPYTHSRFYSKWLYGNTSNEKSKLLYRCLLAVYQVQSLQVE